MRNIITCRGVLVLLALLLVIPNVANSQPCQKLGNDVWCGDTGVTTLQAGSGKTVDVTINNSKVSSLSSTGETFSGTLIGTGTATLGWVIVAGANTACTTTCVTPCVFGVNNAATEADIVGCADATADECLCAGAS